MIKNKKQIQSLSDYILEQIQDIDYDRQSRNLILKNKVDSVLNAVESYCTLVECCGYNDYKDEAKFFEKKIKSIVSEYKYRKSLCEGFENPFNDEYDAKSVYTNDMNYVYHKETRDIPVKKVQLWNRNTNNKIVYKNGKMYAGQFFGKGDVIEECPIRLIHEEDLYSKTIRDFAFEIDRTKGLYAVPFGYASYYRNSKESGLEPNASYTFDLGTDFIQICADVNISKGDEIILMARDEDFGNEIKPGQFEYKYGQNEPYSHINKCKLV